MMAVLTTQELRRVRNHLEKKQNGAAITWSKSAINAASQAVEDLLDAPSTKAAISGAIDTALTPYGVTLTNAQKKWLVAKVFESKFIKDQV